MYVYWILFSNSLCTIYSAYLYCTALSVNKPQLNPILMTSFNPLCFLICLLLLLFGVYYMLCFNVPLLNSLSAKKKREKKKKKKKKVRKR
jgi:hypothetical protein